MEKHKRTYPTEETALEGLFNEYDVFFYSRKRKSLFSVLLSAHGLILPLQIRDVPISPAMATAPRAQAIHCNLPNLSAL